MKNMSDKGFLILLKVMRVFTIIVSAGSIAIAFMIYNLLTNQPTQVTSVTAKGGVISIGILSLITFFNCFIQLIRSNRNENKVISSSFAFDSLFQIIALVILYFVGESFKHLLSQPATSNLALQNSHDASLLLLSLFATLLIAGILSITNSLLKNYSIKHFEHQEPVKQLNVINNNQKKDQRKAPRKK